MEPIIGVVLLASSIVGFVWFWVRLGEPMWVLESPKPLSQEVRARLMHQAGDIVGGRVVLLEEGITLRRLDAE